MRILVTGGRGLLGSAAADEGRARGWDVVAPGRAELDVTRPDAVREAVTKAAPDLVLHCAAYTAVDRAETQADLAMSVNRDGTRAVAEACAAAGALLVYPSTDYVFDGRKGSPYRPDDPPSPLSAYGRSKLAGEEEARRAPRHLVVRTSWLYGSGGRNFVDTMLALGGRGGPLQVVDDQRGRPTWTRSLAGTLLDLVEREAAGTFHATDSGEATWRELAVEALRLAGLVEVAVEPVSTEAWGAAAPRPPVSLLDVSETERVLGRPMPHWKESLARHVRERTPTLSGADRQA